MFSCIYSVAMATAWLQGGGGEDTDQHQPPKEPTWLLLVPLDLPTLTGRLLRQGFLTTHF